MSALNTLRAKRARKRTRRLTLAERQALAARYWSSNITLKGLARELRISQQRAKALVYRYRPAGAERADAVAPPKTRPKRGADPLAKAGTLWTEEEDALLEVMVREGAHVRRIAARVQRPVSAVHTRIIELGGMGALRAGMVFTLQQTMALFGVAWHAINAWIERGYLVVETSPGGRREGAAVLIARANLERFVAVRDAWPTYEAEAITDMALRRQALQARSAAGGRWLSAAEVAEREHVSRSTVRVWMRQGLPHVIQAGAAYIWDADLPRWLAEREQQPSRRRREADERARPLVEAAEAGASLAAIAAATDLTENVVRCRIASWRRRHASV